MMEAMQKGKTGFLYGFNKSGKLTEWAEFYFNFPKRITDEQMLRAYAAGQLEVVQEFAANQIIRTYELWKLWNIITNTSTQSNSPNPGNPGDLLPPSEETPGNPGSNINIDQCKKCLANIDPNNLLDGDKCPICKTLI